MDEHKSINIIHMELRHLKMISEVAKQGSLTRAAEHLFLSQSALSHQLKDIEDFFDTQIFIRQKRQMFLTPTGQIILEAGEKIISELEQAKNRIQYLKDKNAGEIRLSTECYTSYHWLSGFLSEFKTVFPQVDIHINPDATYNSISCLLENKIDIGIVEDKFNPKLSYTTLFKDEFMAIVPNGHPWTRLKWVSADKFIDEQYIMYTIPNELSTVFKRIFKNATPRKVYKISLTEAIIQMVKAGMGVAVLPHWVVRPHVQSGELSAVRVTKNGIRRTWYAAVLKNRELPAYMQVFIRNLSRHLKSTEELSLMKISRA